MPLEVIPHSLYAIKHLVPLLSDGRSSILHKTLHHSLVNMGKYVTMPLIVYLLQGRQVIRDGEGVDHVIEEDHLVFLPKDVYFVSDFVADSGPFEALLFFVDERLIEQCLQTLAAPRGARQGLPRPDGQRTHVLMANPQIRQYMTSLRDVYQGKAHTAALLALKLQELLHLIAMQDQSLGFVEALVHERALRARRQITDFMDQAVAHHLTVADCAALTGRSVSTFIRDFKKAYDTTPHQWLMGQRVDQAHRLLTEQNIGVNQAAQAVGYDNVSHFIKAYKRKFGVTPKQAKALKSGLHL